MKGMASVNFILMQQLHKKRAQQLKRERKEKEKERKKAELKSQSRKNKR